MNKVIVVGLDGLEPKIVEPMLQAGELPNLARLRAMGGYARVRTTLPAQTPVAWSTFSTGTNPGGHGIYDFVRRDPSTYLPDLGLNRYEQKNAFVPPKVVNLRRGVPLWQLLSDAGIPSVVLRCPCTYPPDNIRGRMLSGMGVPDLRGGNGTSTLYTSAHGVMPQESENVVCVDARSGEIETHLIGPRNPKAGGDARLPIRIRLDAARHSATLQVVGEGGALELREGGWSDWLHVKFKLGMLQSVRGMVRFYLASCSPDFQLYASPLNFDADAPLFPISSPWEYAAELRKQVGTYYTTGMIEDHNGLSNGRFEESTYLEQCQQVLRERERMMLYELERMKSGLFFCLFDTPDRIQHMFWRFREADHPANRNGNGAEFRHVIEDHYRECDGIVGRAMEFVEDDTLMMVLSDHGFNSFRRGVHLNTWLHDNGFLALKNGLRPGEEAGDFLRAVDWHRTRAYALGLGSIYLNLRGREAEGIVRPEEAPGLKTRITAAMSGFRDVERDAIAINGVAAREDAYRGECAAEAPDLVVRFAPGYRVSWATALGGVPEGHIEDNVKRWGGDHIIDPALIPGVLFMNRAFDGSNARLLDMAPTILAALGAPKGAAMEGDSLMMNGAT